MPELPLPAQIMQIATGYLLPRCLHAVAEAGIADALGDAPMTADALARATGKRGPALHRILRLIATAGVFESHGDHWTHTPLSRALRDDHPQSMRAFVRMIGDHLNWGAVGELDHALATGRPSVEKLAPDGIWPYFQAHPDEARIFDAAMTAKSQETIAAVTTVYDFTRYGTIADIAGGRGHLLAAALSAAPQAEGILFDQADVVAAINPTSRMTLAAGDFFKDALPVADAYLLSNILHDWADAEATSILLAIRRAAPKHAHLLVLESILPETPEPHLSKTLDIIMLTMTGGKERTRAEYDQLLSAGGFRLDRVVATTSPVSIIVGTPVEGAIPDLGVAQSGAT